MGERARRYSGLAVACLGILLGASIALQAQGVRYDNIVLGPRGGPVASATVAVCAAGATTSTSPCSPLATVYSDEALTQPMANPFKADSLGNYGFWAAPGHYVVQIYGAGVTTRTMNVFLPCDPSNCSMANASISSITAGTLNLTGSLTVNGRPVATEPKADDAVMYVSPNGNDSANGLSWGSAKKTLYGAISALTTGATIYVAANAACGGPLSGQGLWLYGGGISSPGSGWLDISGKPLNIIGVGTTGWAAASPSPQVVLNCGSATEPALWINTNNLSLKFTNLYFQGSVGADLENATSITFDSDAFVASSANTTDGPGVLIGSASFELYFRHCVFYANQNSGVTRNGADATEAFVVNPGTGNPNSDLIYITQSIGQYGDIKFYTNGTTSWTNGLVVNGFLTENQQDGKGAVWFPANSGGSISGTGTARLDDVGVADAVTNPTPAVQVDGTVGSDQIIASDLAGEGVNAIGPMTLLSSYSNNFQNMTELPLVEGQVGPFGTSQYWKTAAGRRAFAPTSAIEPNLVHQNPASWGMNGGVTETNVLAPDGSMDAGKLTNSNSYTAGTQLGSSGFNASPGGYVIFGFWYNASNSSYLQPIGCSGGVTLNSTSVLPATETSNPSSIGGEWEFYSDALKVTNSGTSCSTTLDLYAPANSSVSYYAPVVMYVPAGTITDSEAALMALNLVPYPDSLNPPVEATLRGHPFAFGGSGDNYFATLDHTGLTANRTYVFPNVSGTIALSGANGVSAGTITLSGGSGSHTFATPYSAAPVCTASDTSTAAAVKVTSSTTGVFITGTGSDVVAWVCSPVTN
jgi:hypothetical protein